MGNSLEPFEPLFGGGDQHLLSAASLRPETTEMCFLSSTWTKGSLPHVVEIHCMFLTLFKELSYTNKRTNQVRSDLETWKILRFQKGIILDFTHRGCFVPSSCSSTSSTSRVLSNSPVASLGLRDTTQIYCMSKPNQCIYPQGLPSIA